MTPKPVLSSTLLKNVKISFDFIVLISTVCEISGKYLNGVELQGLELTLMDSH